MEFLNNCQITLLPLFINNQVIFKVTFIFSIVMGILGILPVVAQQKPENLPNLPPPLQILPPGGNSPLPNLPKLQPNINTPGVRNIPSLPGVGSIVPEPAYTLGAGDRIIMEIFNVPEYSKEYQVLVDGSLNLPLLGTTFVQGLSLQDAANLISNKYSPYLTKPLVTITLLGPRPLNIAIAGEITRPGSYKILPVREAQQGLQFPTLVQVLQLAKGITAAAELRNIQVRRPQRYGPDQVIVINLWDFFRNGDLRQDITLRDGDSIFVPTATTINADEIRERINANFSADLTQPISVVIIGQVGRPGPYTISANDLRSTPTQPNQPNQPNQLGFLDENNQPPGNNLLGLPTVSRAIKVAGGIKPDADLRRIEVRRRPRGGAEQTLTANLWKLLQTGDITQDILLQEGDSIIIPKAEAIDVNEAKDLADASFSPNFMNINIIGEVVKPGTIQIAPNTGLVQGILAAGGFNERRAQKSSVELIRLNQNGTVSRRTIPVDLSQGLNEKNNPILQNNDVIIVGRSGLTRFTDTLGTVLSPFTGVFGVFRLLLGL